MKKRKPINFPVVLLSSLGVLVIALGVYVYFALNGPDYTRTYLQRISEGTIINPVSEFKLDEGSLSDLVHLQGIEGINLDELKIKSVNYMSVKLFLYNLHNIPLTKDYPRLQVYLDDNHYSIEIIKGEIYVKDEEIADPDIIIRTTLDEVAKIIENPEYAKTSFNSGKSSVEIKAGYLELLLKGYGKIYSMLPKM